MKKLLFIFGTRPEAIKLAPLAQEFQRHPSLYDVRVCLTGQHREMARAALEVFGLKPSIDLDLMLPGQTLFQSTSRILGALEQVFREVLPDMALVQGDTTSTLCGALGSFYAGVPIAHIEAGLRTHNLHQPFPEEANRVLTGRLATLHFAATPWAAENLKSEGVPASRITVTGNTGIDALMSVARRLEAGELPAPKWPFLNPGRRMILVTGHRRENFGDGFTRFCRALRRLADRSDITIVYPVHPNPNVRGPVHEALGQAPNIALIDPQGYADFIDLMRRADILITDSGGVQEEGPSLGKPILVSREVTERPEAVTAGTVRLVGTDEEKVVREAEILLDDPAEYQRRAAILNPYGDGQASPRIEAAIRSYFELP
jgi:UDP-N-acetylglucosamine 2-epimerase (non-hydrolysing)